MVSSRSSSPGDLPGVARSSFIPSQPDTIIFCRTQDMDLNPNEVRHFEKYFVVIEHVEQFSTLDNLSIIIMDQSVLTLQQDVSNLALGLGVQGKFLDALKLRKIYDVRTKQPSTMPLGFSPLASAGQPAVVSDQGNNMTCSSHAVGKAGVEIIDGLGMDCDQDKIIQDLITTVQPKKQPCLNASLMTSQTSLLI